MNPGSGGDSQGADGTEVRRGGLVRGGLVRGLGGGIPFAWMSMSKSDCVIPSPATGGGSSRGLGRGGRDTGHGEGDGQGVGGTGVRRRGRAVWAMGVPHSVLFKEVADFVVLVSNAGLVKEEAVSEV